MTEPLRLDEEWNIREVGLIGPDARAVFDPFARHTEHADVVTVQREGAAPIIMLSERFWHRVLATVARANDYPLPDKANG